MKLNQTELLPAVDGYIFVEKDSDSEPVFKVTQTYHEQRVEKIQPEYVLHPVSEKLRGSNSLRSIPVKVLFDTPRLNMTGRYEAWSDLCPSGPVCVGDGEKAKVFNQETGAWSAMPCRGPGLCPRAALNDVTCSFRARMPVEIVHESCKGKIFEFRTNSLNSFKALIGAMQKEFVLQGALRHINFNLVGWVKSSPVSHYESFACASMEPAGIYRDMEPINEAWEAYGQRCAQVLLDECYPTEMEKMSLQGLVPQQLRSCFTSDSNRKSLPPAESPFAIVMQQVKGNLGESKAT